MEKNLEEFFESVYSESNKMKEERSKEYYNGFYTNASGEFVPVTPDVEDKMNLLGSVKAMEDFLRKTYKGRDVKVEVDNTIGWEKHL